MDLIRIKDVTKTYKNGVTALYNISLDIEKGEFVFVIGATGCGKSTLIKTMYREERPTSGTITVGGLDVTKLRNSKVYKIRRKIGVVFQDYKLLPIDLCLPPYKRITVENENEVINGKMFDNIYNEPIIFENKNKEPIAIYKIYEKDNKKIKPWKMLKKLNNIKK